MPNRRNTRRTGCSSRRRTNRRTNRRTSGGEIGAPYPGSLYAEQNQPSYRVMDWSTRTTAEMPSAYEMKHVVARGGSRRKHRRKRSHRHGKHGKHGKHSKRHTRR